MEIIEMHEGFALIRDNGEVKAIAVRDLPKEEPEEKTAEKPEKKTVAKKKAAKVEAV